MLFIEKFLFPVLAAIAVAAVLANPMKWDWQSRIALLICVVAFAFLLSHQIQIQTQDTLNSAARTATDAARPVPTDPPPQAARHKSSMQPSSTKIEQHSSGANSPNVVAGDGSTVTINGK